MTDQTKLVVIETMQFFEIEIPVELDAEHYITTQECRDICADKIQSGMTDLQLERVLTKYNKNTESWEE